MARNNWAMMTRVQNYRMARAAVVDLKLVVNASEPRPLAKEIDWRPMQAIEFKVQNRESQSRGSSNKTLWTNVDPVPRTAHRPCGGS
jgi:hypothetical protein